MIELHYFAALRDALDTSGEQLVLPASVNTVAGLRGLLAERAGEWQLLAEPGRTLVAVNQQMANDQAAVKAGDEVAFFPPVTGG